MIVKITFVCIRKAKKRSALNIDSIPNDIFIPFCSFVLFDLFMNNSDTKQNFEENIRRNLVSSSENF
jgi:hypothetical protein